MFTPKFFEFLSENRFRNDRVWFAEHRAEFDSHVIAPLAELVDALAPALAEVDPFIVTEPKVDKTISRVYRDMRRAADGLLYRDEMWLSFKRDKRIYAGYPEFYFVMKPDEFFYGCGYYKISSAARNSLRKLVLAGDPLFTVAAGAYEALDGFMLEGDKYKKSKFPDRSERQRDWLDRPNICVSCEQRSVARLFDKNLVNRLRDEIIKLAPIYKLLLFAEENKII